MAFIEISDLSPVGSELFTDKESFLTELQATDSNQIFGGGKSRNKKRGGNSSGGKGGSSSGGKRGRGYGCGWGYGGGHGYNGGGSS